MEYQDPGQDRISGAGTSVGGPKDGTRGTGTRSGHLGPRPARVALLALLAVALMAFPTMALSPVGEGPEPLPTEGACDGEKADALEAAHARLLALYAEQPGFVDVLVGAAHDPAADRVSFSVLFDEQAREDPPVVPGVFGGFPVEGVSTSFLPLPAVEDELGVQADNLVPSACPQEIRPGARMTSPAGCTFSFVFKGDDDRFYISTAGHCVSTTGERVSAAGVGGFGTVVYKINQGIGADFAMIRVDSDKEHLVNPELCHWGGPTRMTSGTSPIVHHYGWGTGFGTVIQTRPRSGVLAAGGSTSASWTGTASPGDSGSAAITSSGAALVTLTHIGIGGVGKTVFGTRVTHGVSLAQDATGTDFTLQTAPLKGDEFGPLEASPGLGPSPALETPLAVGPAGLPRR